MIRTETWLWPIDLSEASLDMFEYSVKLVKNYRARLHLLHVIAPMTPMPDESNYIDTVKLTASLRDRAETEFRKLRRIAANIGVETQSEIRAGPVQREIAEAVERHNADLVILGRHTRHGIERWLLGSTTERLLRQLQVPMLIISEDRSSSPRIRRILMPADFSARTAEAVSDAMAFAQGMGARLTLMHVMPQKAAGMELPPTELTVEEVQHRLNDLIPEKARKASDVTTKIESGIPFERILKVAESTRPDVLVLSLHRKGFLERVLLGSTAERVIRGARCPILALPPKRTRRRVFQKRAA